MGPGIPNIARRSKALTGGLALLCGLAGFAAALAITAPPGPGLDPDSASYLGAAESLAAGSGYRIPIAVWSSPDSSGPLSHFPPGFSTAIALPVALGAPAVQSARVIDALAAGIALGVATYAVMLAAGIVAGLALGGALVVTSAFVDVQLSILSEPLFIACFALLILALGAPRSTWTGTRPAELRGLLGAALVAAIAVLVRYAGIAATGAVALWALLPGGRVRDRLVRAGVVLLPTIVLFGAWVVRTHFVSGPGSIRQLAFYGGFGPTLATGRDTIVHWIVPWSGDDPLPYQGWFALAALVSLGALVALGVRALVRQHRSGAASERSRRAQRTLTFCALLAASYVVVLVLSRVLADPGIPFDQRILAPLLFVVEVATAVALSYWWRGARVRWRIPVALGLLSWGVAAAMDVQNDVSWALEHGVDFASDEWRYSRLVQWARTTGRDRPLYSNWPVVIYFHLHRHAWELPVSNSDSATLGAFGDTLRARHGAVLAFDAPSPGYAPPDSLARVLGLQQLMRFPDGSIFVARAADSSTARAGIRESSRAATRSAVASRGRSR